MVRSDIHTALALIVPAHPARSPAAVLPRRHREKCAVTTCWTVGRGVWPMRDGPVGAYATAR